MRKIRKNIRLPRKHKKIAKYFRDNILVGQHNALLDSTSLVDIYNCLSAYAPMYKFFIKNKDVFSYVTSAKYTNNTHMYNIMFRYKPVGSIDIAKTAVYGFYDGGICIDVKTFVDMHRFESEIC